MNTARLLLACGAAAGLAAAAASLFDSAALGPAQGEGVVAVVNQRQIRRQELERATDAVAADRREPLSPADRRFVLDRMIEEELLIQHALALGLAERDRRVRSDLVSAVMGSLVASADGYAPEPGEVERFYSEQREFFARPGRTRLRQIFVGAEPRRPEADARARAQEAARRLRAGEAWEDIAAALGDAVIAEIPAAALPETEIGHYIGPSAARVASRLEPGATSEVLRSAQGFHLLQVLAREPERVPPLLEIEDQVRAELVRRAGDRAVRERLDTLRAAARVEIADPLP